MNPGKMFDVFPSPPRECGYWNDWHTDEELLEYVVTDKNSGTATVIDTDRGGYIQISGAATTDDSGKELQRDAITIKLETGKKLRLLGTLYLSDSTQSDAFFGIFGQSTTIIASPPNDGVFFRKDDGDQKLDCIVRASGVEVVTGTGAYTMADATEVELAIEVAMSSTANKGTVKFWVNGTLLVSSTSASMPSGMMAVAFGMISGNTTGTKTAKFDYDGVWWQR